MRPLRAMAHTTPRSRLDRSLELAFAALDEHERAAIEGILATLRAELAAVPGLAQAVRYVAALRIAADVQAAHRMDELPALREAAVALGFADPATSAESIARALRRWRENGRNVRPPDYVGSNPRPRTHTEESKPEHEHRHGSRHERKGRTEPDFEGRKRGPHRLQARAGAGAGRERAG